MQKLNGSRVYIKYLFALLFILPNILWGWGLSQSKEWVSPTPSSYSTITYDVGDLVNVRVKADGISNVLYKLSNSGTQNDGMAQNFSIDSSTGVITGKFADGNVKNKVKFYAGNSSNRYQINRTIYIQSNAVSGDPEWKSPTPNEGITLTYDVGENINIPVAVDPSSGITYRLSGTSEKDGMSSLTMNSSSGTITGSFTEGNKNNRIKFYAYKDNAKVLTRIIYLQSNAASGDPEWISPTPNSGATLTYNVGENINIPVAVDPSSGITYRLSSTSEDDGMSSLAMSSSTGTITGSFTEGGKNNRVKFYAYKDGNKILNRTIYLHSQDSGTPPTLNSITPNPNNIIKIDDSINLDLSSFVSKTDNDNILSYNKTGALPDGVNFDSSTGLISGNATQTGEFPIDITVTDKDGESNKESFVIKVTGTPPTIDTIADQTIKKDVAFNSDLSGFVHKTQNDDITDYELTGTLPDGISFNNGVLSGTSVDIGSFPVSLTATDIDGVSDSKSFDIVVSEDGTSSPTNGLNARYYDGTNFSGTPKISRVDAEVDWDWGNGNPGGGLGNNNFSITWTGWIYIPEDGNYQFWLKHDDDLRLTIDGEELYYLNTWSKNKYKSSKSKSFTMGYYPIEIKFIEKGGGANVHVMWQNNKNIIGKTIVPTTNLFPDEPVITYVENADDICYADFTFTGMMCMDMGMCKGGIGCTTGIPLDNVADSTLEQVHVYYDESGMGGTMSANCAVEPSGECDTGSNIDMGPMGMLGTTTSFAFTNSIAPEDTNARVSTTAAMSMSCLSNSSLYATYVKDGVNYRGKVVACDSTTNEELDDETIPDDNPNILPETCGVFEDALQTRAVDSKVDFSSGSAKVYNNPDTNLNTYSTPVNGGSGNDITCNDTAGINGDNSSCIPSMKGAKAFSDPTNGMKYPATFTIASPVSTSTTNVNYTTSTSGTKLTDSGYNSITSDWNSGTTSIPFEVTTSVAVNTIKNGADAALVTFKSADSKEYQFSIDKLQTKEDGEFKTTDNLAKNIKIGTISGYNSQTQGSAKILVDFKAIQTIKIDKLYIAHTSKYTLRAPYININSIKDVSGVGQENIINIIADYIDIGDFEVGDATRINIMPYTSGKKVVVKMNLFDTGSNNHIEFDSGTYYIKTLSTQGSGSGYNWNMHGKVNLIIEDDYETVSQIGINSDTTGGSNLCNDTHSALNLFIFAYGDFYVHNDSRIVGAIYSKKDVKLGSASYIKGAVSAENKIRLDNDTQVCYDSDLADSGYGDCNATGDEEDEPEISQCGIFPSALQTYERLTLGGGVGNEVSISSIDNIVAPYEKVIPTVDSSGDDIITYDALCDSDFCKVIAPNIIDYNIPFKSTTDLSTTTLTASSTISQKEVGSYVANARNITISFNATEEYNSGRKYMMIGNLDSGNKTGIKYTFTEGDYYINSWRHQGNDLTIESTGKVRIFLRGVLRWEGNSLIINKGGTASNFFIFGQNDFEFPNNGSAQWDVTGYLYTKGKFTLSANSNSGEGFVGAITAENDLYLNNNAKFKYDSSGLASNGMGSCSAFVQFGSNKYIFKEPAIDGGVEYLTYQDVNITLNEVLDYDVVVEYQTFDGNPFDERIHAEVIHDYTENNPNPETITIPAGKLSATVSTTINRDNRIENDETFFGKLKLITTGKDVTLGNIRETNLTISVQTEDDVPLCFEDGFNTELDDKWRTLFSSGGYEPAIVNGRLRLTDRGKSLSTAVTKDYYFLAKWNLIEVEYLQYAYGGCERGSTATKGGGLGRWGADGIVMVLFDSNVGHSPEPGSFGGSMGYAQGHGKKGFEGGWIGLGIDEYGNFSNPNEGRNGGVGFKPNNVTIRGSSGDLSGDNRYSGYKFLGANTNLDHSVATKMRNSAYPGDRYKFRIDARDPSKLLISLQQDSGNGYKSVISEFDAKDPMYDQAEAPEKVRLAFTSGTGGGCNNHEIDELRVKGVCRVYNADLYNKGPFSAWNTDSNIDKKITRTKIVNQNFQLLLASLNHERNLFEAKEKIHDAFPFYAQAVATLMSKGYMANIASFDIKVLYQLVDASSPDDPTVITTLVDNGDSEMFNATKNDKELKSFKVAGAYKDVRVQFTMCADYSDVTEKYTVYPYEACQNGIYYTVNQPNRLGYRLVYSDDAFAIRPDKFDSNIDKNYIAQQASSITFNALDKEGKKTLRYNEKQGNSFNVSLINEVRTCDILDPSITPNVDFRNGTVTNDYLLPNVSTYKLNISEIEGKEFAFVDSKEGDTVDDERFITPFNTTDIITVRPSSLKIDGIALKNFNNNSYTHLSDLSLDQIDILDNTMAADLRFAVTALRDDDSVATNYSGGCSAQNTEVSFDFDTTEISPPNTVDSLKYVFTPSGGTKQIWDMPKLSSDPEIFLQYDIDKNEYSNGIATIKIPFNFTKNLNIPSNPFDLNISDITATESVASNSGITPLSTLASTNDTDKTYSNQNVTFIYSRVRSSQKLYAEVTENFETTPILSDVFCTLPTDTCDEFVTDLTDSIINENGWFINRSFNAVTQKDGSIGSLVTEGSATVKSINIISDGTDESVTVTNNGEDQTVTVQLQPSPWLRYDSEDSMGLYKYEVEFITAPTENWSGVGDRGHIIDTNGSTSQRRQRVNW